MSFILVTFVSILAFISSTQALPMREASDIRASIASDFDIFEVPFSVSTLNGTANGIQVLSSVHQQNLGRTDPENVQDFLNTGGYVKYGGFGAGQEARYADALINSDTITLADQNRLGSPPKQSILPSGWNQMSATGREKQRCHLIAKSLGGSGKDARNLVTCHRNANAPVMRHYENRVRDLVRTFPKTGPWRRDKGVRHTVTPNYHYRGTTPTPAYPASIRIRSSLHISGKFSHVLQDVSVVNTVRSGSTVRFNCAGTMKQDAAPSVTTVHKTNTPC